MPPTIKEQAENAAMIPGSLGGLIAPLSSPVIAESVRQQRRSRYNPLVSLTGSILNNALDAFVGGDYRAAAILWQTIAERDDTIPGVKAKREKSVAHKRRETVMLEKSTEAERHKQALEDFWDNCSWVSAWDRQRRGGFSRLICAMQEAVSYKLSHHHIVWKPRRDGRLRATFEHVPLQFFEGRDGISRFLRGGFGIEGEPLDEREWLVSSGDGLMIACSIGYAAKRLSLMDWLRFSEKFAMPGVIGKTSAAQGTDAGKAMKAAVASFGNDWSATIYGADGSEAIELIEANGNPNAMPMPALIEMVNRKFAALYRGADLSTMSSGSEAEGSGASLQGEESDILERDDAAQRSEELQGVERTVIEWYFGRDVEPLAKTVLQVPEREDLRMLLEATKVFVEMGGRIPIGETVKRFGMSEADDDEAAFSPSTSVPGTIELTPEADELTTPEDIAANARTQAEAEDELLSSAAELVALARREDTAALQARLREIYTMSEPAALREALVSLRDDLPTYIDETPEADRAWTALMLAAVAAGWAEVEPDESNTPD